MKKISSSAMGHCRSSSDLRPSRKFMTMVNKIRATDRNLQSNDSSSDRVVLQNLVNKADELSFRGKVNRTFEDIEEEGNCSARNVSFDMEYDRIVRNVSYSNRKPSTSLDVPRSRCPSPIQEGFQFGQKLVASPLAQTSKDKIKKLSTQKKPEFEKLDDMIGKALQDLSNDKRPRLILRKTPVKIRPSMRKKIKHSKHENIQTQVISVLLCLMGFIIVFFVI